MRGNVLIVTPRINTQSVLVLDVLQSRLASGGTTTVVQKAASLDVAIGSLDGVVVLKGSAITASIGSSTGSSRVVVD